MSYDPRTDIHSRVTVTFKDDSIRSVSKPLPVDYTLFQPFFSDEGTDRVIKNVNSELEMTSTFGNPVFKKHGQHYYNALNWLRGGGTVKGLRLTANDARNAYGIVCIRTKVISKTFQIPDPNNVGQFLPINHDVMVVSPTMVGVPVAINIPVGLSSEEELKLILTTMNKDPLYTGTDGWTYNYIQGIKVKGRGKYGNKYILKYSLNMAADGNRNQKARRYYFEVLKKETAGSPIPKTNAWSVSFDDTALDVLGRSSEYIDTVVTSKMYKEAFDELLFVTHQPAYDAMIESFAPLCTAINVPNEITDLPQDIDFLFLLSKEGGTYTRFVESDPLNPLSIPPAGLGEEIDFSNTGGYLAGGTDGELDPADVRYASATIEVRNLAIETAKENLLIDAYSGVIDEDLLSPYKHQVNQIIDANNSFKVKQAMQWLCMFFNRSDVYGELDMGFVSNYEVAINTMKAEYTGFNSAFMSMYPQAGEAYDPYTKTNIPVTYCYELAFLLPYVRSTKGAGKHIANNKKAPLTTMNKIYWVPKEPHKTPMKKAKLNYVEEVKIGEFCLVGVRTLYAEDYSYFTINTNVRAMCEISYLCRNILINKRFEDDLPANVMSDAKSEIMTQVNYLKMNGPIEKLDIVVYRTGEDEITGTARVDISCKFKDFIETWHTTIIAKR